EDQQGHEDYIGPHAPDFKRRRPRRTATCRHQLICARTKRCGGSSIGSPLSVICTVSTSGSPGWISNRFGDGVRASSTLCEPGKAPMQPGGYTGPLLPALSTTPNPWA